MAEGPDRGPSFSALLLVSAEQAGALKADRAERRRVLNHTPELIEQPPIRRRFGGEWQHRVLMHDGEISASPRMRPTTPAGSPGAAGNGLLELMSQPWRLLGGYQFADGWEEAVVAGRQCWIVSGVARVAEPVLDPFVYRWVRGGDSGQLAIDKELGIATSITASFGDRTWYRAELHDFKAQDPVDPGESIEFDNDELETVHADEAMKRLQFPLYLPERVPRGSEMQIEVSASGTRATVSFETNDSQWRVVLEERPAEAAMEEDLEEWERLQSSAWDGWIWDKSSDPSQPGQRWMVVRTASTHCSLHSALPRSLLGEIAGSLKPQR